MYDQRREHGADESKWPHRIIGGREIVDTRLTEDAGTETLQLIVRQLSHTNGHITRTNGQNGNKVEEILDVDLIVAATGYQRRVHVDIMKGVWELLPEMGSSDNLLPGADGWVVNCQTDNDSRPRRLEVDRQYRVKFSSGTVDPTSGIWLQGCCEGTHGVRLRTPKFQNTEPTLTAF